MTDNIDRDLIMREWRGRPHAKLVAADVCRRVSRATNRSVLTALLALLDEEILERAGGGLRLTDAGQKLVAGLPRR